MRYLFEEAFVAENDPSVPPESFGDTLSNTRKEAFDSNFPSPPVLNELYHTFFLGSGPALKEAGVEAKVFVYAK